MALVSPGMCLPTRVLQHLGSVIMLMIIISVPRSRILSAGTSCDFVLAALLRLATYGRADTTPRSLTKAGLIIKASSFLRNDDSHNKLRNHDS